MKRDRAAAWIASAVFGLLAGCATQSPPVAVKEAPQTMAAQKEAQQKLVAAAPTAPTLKRKIALGRISNETHYGQSLLRAASGDPLGKQVTDLLSADLTASGAFIVLERPDIARLKDEADLSGIKMNTVGADVLVIGSLTEFGRKTIGETGFVSSSKKQVSFAKVDLRLVDTGSGQVFFATSGAGEAATESSSTFGFGSTAAYDGTLNDAAIRQAISEAVNRLTNEMKNRPWQTGFLSADQGRYFIAGGKSQGLKPGLVLSVQTQGERVKSPQTGFLITLPGREVATLRVDSTFGESEADEGSVGSISSGSIQGYKLDQLVLRSKETP
ncbi:MAG TPA: CsgG/HfaB family protein [Burkholderiaceae bacterium]|jgi:curli biogenesis system outer membrane secretion channel CsgG|nr:CsgG/HfaB family protein [Burkholderiaceae bacterium]